MQAKDQSLGTERIGILLAKLAAPAIAAQLVNMLYNMVDRVYIGHIEGVGAAALTGVGVCMPIILIIAAFAALVSMGGAPRASIEMGRKDIAAAEKIMGNCALLLLITALTLTLILLPLREKLLMLFGASKNTLPYASEYLGIYILGTLFVEGTLGLNAFITAQGFAATSMLTVLIGAVLNTILDPVFIFVFDMGVKGAALATVLSQAVSCAWVTAFLLGKKTLLRLRLSNFKPDLRIIGPCVALGLSPFIMQSTESLLSVCFNTSLMKYGGDLAVGAMTILSSVFGLAMMPIQGLTQGCQPIVSYNYGAGSAQRVKTAFSLLLKCCVAYSVALWLIAMLAPGLLASIFTSDEDLIAYVVWALRIYMAVSCLFGIQIACQQTFIALGNAKTSLFLAVLRKIILLIPLIFILPHFFDDKVFGVLLAEPVADFLAVCTTFTLFMRCFRAYMKQSSDPGKAI